MEQSNSPTSRNSPLERLVTDALGEIERLGYSRRSLSRYRAVWEHLVEFSDQEELGDEFAGDLAVRFLEEYRLGDEQVDKPGEGWRRHMVWGVKVLADFARTRHIERAFTEVEAIHLVPAMQDTLRDYEQYCKDRLHLRPRTLHRRKTELTIFLDFLHSRKARTLDQIQALDLSEFVSCRDHLQPKTVARIVSDVRSFLRFLTMRGILQRDLSVELPRIRVPRDAAIPSVWDHELVIRLLGAVDRSSAKGKRDYAILLLACRLGLRAGDIRTLKLDQLHWEDSTIELTQSKTGLPLSLPLTSEVGEALIDYLKLGRPPTPHREVFLKVNPPFDPFMENNNLHHIVTYWRRLAGITFRTPQKRGIHSLRHTLATRLLEKGTPFTTIAEILGHTSLESTRIYAKADVEALRSVALDPEEVDLSVGDVRLDPPAQLRLLGKGRKMRAVPLMDNTAQLLRDHIHENHLDDPEQFDKPLFRNARNQRLSRSGIRYILQKHLVKARSKCPTLNRTLSPHTLRHSKGMHLLQSGVSLDMIRDFLGHVDVKTTQIYARANLEMKRQALIRRIINPSES